MQDSEKILHFYLGCSPTLGASRTQDIGRLTNTKNDNVKSGIPNFTSPNWYTRFDILAPGVHTKLDMDKKSLSLQKDFKTAKILFEKGLTNFKKFDILYTENRAKEPILTGPGLEWRMPL